MIIIKHPPIKKRPKNREIMLSANCAEVLKFLINYAKQKNIQN